MTQMMVTETQLTHIIHLLLAFGIQQINIHQVKGNVNYVCNISMFNVFCYKYNRSDANNSSTLTQIYQYPSMHNV